MLHGLRNSKRVKKVKKLQHRRTPMTLSMCETSTGGMIKTKMTHLTAAEPRLLPALFGRDRGTASPHRNTCRTAIDTKNIKKTQNTVLSQLLSSSSSLCKHSSLWLPLYSLPLSAHYTTTTTTPSLTTPSLSSSELFVRCHGDYKRHKDQLMRLWTREEKSRSSAHIKDPWHWVIIVLFSRITQNSGFQYSYNSLQSFWVIKV